jgi:REP element-mobilizing transposase RayT
MTRIHQRVSRTPHESAERRASNRARRRGHRRVRARCIIPGTRYKITRKCLERRLFLTPDSGASTRIIGFCLGMALDRFDIELHAAVFMSNHYHLDVTDPHGQLPAFKCMLNAFIARALNAHRGRFDRFWSTEQGCDVELIDDVDLIEGIAYTQTNPVTAGLVRRGYRWPGLTTAGKKFGEVMRFKRPDFFFDPKNDDVPLFVEVRIVRPSIMPELSDDELYAKIREAVVHREREAAEKMRREHRRFLGEQRIARQSWRRTPGNRDERFASRPRVSSRGKWARIAALQRNVNWDAAYAKAYDALSTGERNVEFPHGTYALRRFAGVRVAQAPP